ncbi:MAG: DNA polymerase IV [Candidatus Krumholzibacteria bacterium]|nr:DNA polymerase IV [Candidatus Krumholzibacteria bacterium]MDH4336873.1 DNA polymerase IV [Candidatus Krumholzibacteria bacterium]MDH5269204.1 DNA polymerase IV [Candidatus Krumholzibacteria bacterium]
MPDHAHRAILHVDMDAFYASVEVMDNPALAGKPVIVGGAAESRGVVSAASYEARTFGVHSAMSSARAHKLCPHGIFITPRMSRYVELSHEIRRIFETYTPLIEPLSIDEAFLDVTASRALFGSGEEIGRLIKRRIRDEVGLVASVGVAPNKYLAKLASDLEKPDGFVVITREEAEARLAPLPVWRLWGVGKVTEKALAGAGILTVGDLVKMPDAQLEAIAGSYAPRLKQLARGIDERPVVPDTEAKSIGAENTFAKDIADADALRVELDLLCERVAGRARADGMPGHTVNLKARYADFTTVTRAMTLPDATYDSVLIRDAARHLLEEKLGRRGRALRLLGVSLSNLVHAEELTRDLFSDTPAAKRETTSRNRALDAVMDRLKEKFGSGAVARGSRAAKKRDDQRRR